MHRRPGYSQPLVEGVGTEDDGMNCEWDIDVHYSGSLTPDLDGDGQFEAERVD